MFPEKHLTVGGDDPFIPSLKSAINYASEICIACAFIRMTGLRLILPALQEAVERGAKLTILTGDYLDFTDPLALRSLMLIQEQGAVVKVFESGGGQSFHMKAYLFTHSSDNNLEGCAFVGSSNLTKTALVDGLEWNLKVDLAEDHERFQQIQDEFWRLFENPRCQALTHQWIENYQSRLSQIPKYIADPGADEKESVPDPNEIQITALDALKDSREEGFQRGLVVMATGLGKTWLAAFDSRQMNAKRVLFVAHREEILNQAEDTFVRICPDSKIGKYNGKERELNVDMLFASVQTLGRAHHLDQFASDYFDYVVVDEFHHAAAKTYQRLLQHFKPRFLLGLTATPDRTDQSDILNLCDNNLVFQCGLIEGVESDLLCPFHYYGVADVVDYTEISWRNGKFDPNELANQLATQARARHNLVEWNKRKQNRTLAFCVSKKHADFMSEYFNRHGAKAVSVHSDSEVRRNDALNMLNEGLVDVVFSVDLFNEGVDLPSIDTVLMLRPTESKILFLQQIGRGLRRSEETGKDKLTILDFIGNHHSFFRKPEAMFGIGVTNKERSEFIDQAETQNLVLAKGCFVNYDLESIDLMRKLIESKIDGQKQIYSSLSESLGRRPSLSEFYRGGGSLQVIQKDTGQWFEFVLSQGDLSEPEKSTLLAHGKFLAEIEKTSLTKSFKLVLLEALVDLNGFVGSTNIEQLAVNSYEILQRRRNLRSDLPAQFKSLSVMSSEEQKKWTAYWKSNPVNAWIGGNKRSSTNFFHQQDDEFRFNQDLLSHQVESFEILTSELVDFRFLQYESRLTAKEPPPTDNVVHLPTSNQQALPYFTDLRIACGHFVESPHETENIEYRSLPLRYGPLDLARHFIARAKGNSMDGGKSAIQDGDYLLLELITPEAAGNGEIVALKRQDATGDDQYILRQVRKTGTDNDELHALNPAFEAIKASEEILPFARLKSVIDEVDLSVHQYLFREEIPRLFGLTFNTGLWQSGHVRPQGHEDQYLLVTLNKQGHARDHRYLDYFINRGRFHWQSQNSVGPSGAKGQSIINHKSNGGEVFLFVRKNKLEAKKAAPFFFCGRVEYVTHTGEKPMSVEWRLIEGLPDDVFGSFS